MKWIADKFGVIIDAESGREVAVISGDAGDLPDRDSYARLIAAAPDLLEALKQVIPAARQLCVIGTRPAFQIAIEDARAAIARAEGL